MKVFSRFTNRLPRWLARSLGLLIVAVAVLSLSGCTGSPDRATAVEPAFKSVQAFTVSQESYLVSLDYRGYVKALATTAISFDMSGKVESVYAEAGQPVHMGDVLAVMDTSNLRTAITTGQLTLQKLQASYEANTASLCLNYDHQQEAFAKTAALYQAGVLTKQVYEDAKYALDSLAQELASLQVSHDHDMALQQNSLQDYQRQLEKAVLAAPFDGYVTAVQVKSGEVASFGSPVLILQTAAQIVSISISGDDYAAVHTGMSVLLEANGQTLAGVVSKVALTPEDSSHTYMVEITPEDHNLATGTLVEVRIPVEEREGVFIPLSAIISMDGANYIYVLEQNEKSDSYIAVKQEIMVGDTYGDKVRVNNITLGTRLILEGVKHIKEYDTVMVVE